VTERAVSELEGIVEALKKSGGIIVYLFQQAKRHPQLLALVQQQFQPLRARIRRDSDLEFLRVAPPEKDSN